MELLAFIALFYISVKAFTLLPKLLDTKDIQNLSAPYEELL